VSVEKSNQSGIIQSSCTGDGRTIAVFDNPENHFNLYKKDFMKKLIVLALLTYVTACTNPEDKATGDADSTPYNRTGNEKNLNTATDKPENQSHANKNDTSASPSTSKQHVNSSTEGTNRSYKAGGDSSKKQ
jgi:hypothetical protein